MIKRDCFAWHEELEYCVALRETYCRKEECKFYRNKVERCRECRNQENKIIDCYDNLKARSCINVY